MSAHRYWRINVTANGDSYYPSLSQLQFASTVGGASLLGSGTASASASQAPTGNLSPAAAIGNSATYWGGEGLPGWWMYDFGAGVSYDVTQVTIAIISGLANYAPTAWTLDYSDDASAWTTAQAFTSNPWATNLTQVFVVGFSTPYVAGAGKPLSATIASVSAITTTLVRTRALSETIASVSTITATLARTRPLSETITSTTLLTATLARIKPGLSETIASTSVIGSRLYTPGNLGRPFLTVMD